MTSVETSRVGNIDRCVNNMLPINQNMIISQGLELILSVFRNIMGAGG